MTVEHDIYKRILLSWLLACQVAPVTGKHDLQVQEVLLSKLHTAFMQIAGGVRLDVPAVPCWVRQQVEQPMVQAGLLPRGYVDSAALNIYHDGTEGEALAVGCAVACTHWLTIVANDIIINHECCSTT